MDGNYLGTEVIGNKLINKTMDFDDLHTDTAQTIIRELNGLVSLLQRKRLKISSWYGKFNLSPGHRSSQAVNRGYGYQSLDGAIDDKNFPWFIYWEIAWIVMNNDFLRGQRVLDLGGSSSLFSFYLASKGLEVISIDRNKALVRNGNIVAEKMNWNLKNYVMDMRKLELTLKYDHIASICVYEHIPIYERINLNKKIRDLLVNNGKFSITFDYRNPCRSAQINTPSDVHEQFVKASELDVRGNKQFWDNGKNYLLQPFYYDKPLWLYKLYCIYKRDFSFADILHTKKENDYTFGALFLKNR